MDRLTGLDASFAYLDTPEAPLAVAMACTFDQRSAPEPYSFDRIRETVDRRLHLIPAMRRRLVEPPAGLDRPRWVEDPDFDLDGHLHRARPHRHGGDEELADATSELLARPFDRDRPLWDMTVLEDLGNERTGSVTRLHHAAIDGVSGAEALANFLDLEPDPGEAVPAAPPWEPDPLPSRGELVVDAVRSSVRRPVDTAVRLRRLGGAGLRLWRHLRDTRDRPPGRSPMPFTAPDTLLNGPLTERRSVAFARVDLEDVNRIRRPARASINDVLLAMCAGGLRRYLRRRDALPDRPLVAAVPVSVRGADTGQAANQVSGTLVELPTDVDDPVESLRRTVVAAAAAKDTHHALGPTMVGDVAELAPPLVMRGLAALEHSVNASTRLPPLANVVISNFAGPQMPLYFAGARLEAAYPLGPLAFGGGLNITAQSYDGSLHIGVNACPDLVEDAHEVAAGLTESVGRLLDASARLDVGVQG